MRWNVPLDIQSEDALGPVVEPKLRERQPELRRPFAVGHDRPGLPHRVVLRIAPVLVVGRVVVIEPHTGGGHPEHIGGATVEVSVELDLNRLGLAPIVPPAQRRLHRVGAEHTSTNVQRAIVVGEPHLHPVGRLGALLRFRLHEIGDSPSSLPDHFVQRAVNPDRAVWHPLGRRLLRAGYSLLGRDKPPATQHADQQRAAQEPNRARPPRYDDATRVGRGDGAGATIAHGVGAGSVGIGGRILHVPPAVEKSRGLVPGPTIEAAEVDDHGLICPFGAWSTCLMKNARNRAIRSSPGVEMTSSTSPLV